MTSARHCNMFGGARFSLACLSARCNPFVTLRACRRFSSWRYRRALSDRSNKCRTARTSSSIAVTLIESCAGRSVATAVSTYSVAAHRTAGSTHPEMVQTRERSSQVTSGHLQSTGFKRHRCIAPHLRHPASSIWYGSHWCSRHDT